MPEHRSDVRVPGRGFLGWIKDAFQAVMSLIFPRRRPDPLQSSDETFEPIDVEGVKAELNLAAQASRYGKKELPDSRESELDGPQESIRERIRGEVDEAYRRANREKERLADALRARSVESLVEKAVKLPAQKIEELRIERRDIRHKIESLTAQRVELTDRLRAYRENHAIDRGPSLKKGHERKAVVTATIALAIVQALANSLLFAQGMERGISQAWMLAALLGAADVGWHFHVARVGTRIHGHRWYERIPGGLAVLLFVITVPVYNLSLVHLRLAVQRFGLSEGAEVWLATLQSNPFGFSDFWSILLLGIGLLCSSLAVVAAWQWDEVIPEYRNIGRKIGEIDGSLGYWRDLDDRMLMDASADAEEWLEEIREQIENNLMIAKAIVSRMERLMENLESFLAGAETSYAALIRFYRDENCLARSTNAPEYFSHPVKLAAKPSVDINLGKFQSFVETQERYTKKLDSLPTDLSEYIKSQITDGDETGDEE